MKELVKKITKYIKENSTEYIIIGIVCAILSGAVLACAIINVTENAHADTITTTTAYYFSYPATDLGRYGTLPGGIGTYDLQFDNSTYRFYSKELTIQSTSISEGVFVNNKCRINVRATGTNYNILYGLFNGQSYDSSTIAFDVRLYYSSNAARGSAILYTRESIDVDWNSALINNSTFNNYFQVDFNGLNLNINGSDQFQFGKNFGAFFKQGYEIIDNVSNASVYPICLIPNETNNIYIRPDLGYNIPSHSDITITGTADDIAYIDTYGNIVVTNPTSDFTVSGTAPSTGLTINPGIYLLPTLQNLRQISPFTSDFPSQIYFKKYSLTQYLTVGIASEQGLQWDYITMGPEELYGDTLTCTSSNANSGPSLFLFENGSGKPIALYENNLTTTGAYAYNEYIFLVVPQMTTASAELEDFISICIKISDSSNINKIIDMTDQMFGYILLNYKNDIITTENTYFDMGYAEGFDDGVSSNIIEGSVTNIISAIFNGLFGTIFAVEIFPGFPLYIFILIPLVFALLGIILWLVRGR